jgi:uncharacterized protein
LRVDDPQHIRVATTLLDDPAIAREGRSFGSLFLVPGMDETLRINGRVRSVAEGYIGIAVEECYLHCAKAFMRSEFWAAVPSDENETITSAEFVERSRFLALASINSEGRADLSPKGDPAGALLKVQGDALWYPDRPGNRRVDSFRNILTQPRIAAMAIIPGSVNVMHLTGRASVTTDDTMRSSFAVGEKAPKLVTRIEAAELSVRRSEALSRARLWPTMQAVHDLDPAEIFKAHIKLSRASGVEAALARAAVSVPGMMRKGLEHDYKKNLY